MNFKDIHRPYQDGLPDRFTWPFRYCPDQAVRLAAEKVIQHIDSDEGLKAAFSEGKMLGVLVVMTGAGKADDGLLHGLDNKHPIDGITFRNVTINGVRLTEQNFSDYFDVNAHVHGLVIE